MTALPKPPEIKVDSLAEGLSLRTKLLVLLIALPFVALALYAALAIQLFKSDKIAYIYDSTSAMNRTITSQIGGELRVMTDRVEAFARSNPGAHLNEVGFVERVFESQELEFLAQGSTAIPQWILVREKVESGSGTNYSCALILPHSDNIGPESFCKKKIAQGTEAFSMFSDIETGEIKTGIENLMAQSAPSFRPLDEEGKRTPAAQEEAVHRKRAPKFTFLKGEHFHWMFVMIPVPGRDASATVAPYVMAGFKLSNFNEIFSQSKAYQSFLIENSFGKTLVPSQLPNPAEPLKEVSEFASFANWPFYTTLTQKGVPTGTEEAKTLSGQEYLVAYSKLGLGDLSVVTLVQKNRALQAIESLRSKSVLFLLAIISAAAILSVFAARSLTKRLRDLYHATKEVAQGKFDIRVQIPSRDEVGGLAQSFNTMAGEVARLLEDNVAKARMEKELETARMVQETLFPKDHFEDSSIEIFGYYKPASECGGDWWNYSDRGDHVLLWIGDATGHGAGAALITSAARSAASVIESLPPMEPAEILRVMNRAVHQTSKGNMLMTFFVAKLDKKTGELSYCNASHEPVLIITKDVQGQVDRKTILPLDESKNPRLGDREECRFKEGRMTLQPGQVLLFYTDGVVDQYNAQEQTWGERKFIKALAAGLSANEQLVPAMNFVREEGETFRGAEALRDDVTFFACKFKGQSSLSEAA